MSLGRHKERRDLKGFMYHPRKKLNARPSNYNPVSHSPLAIPQIYFGGITLFSGGGIPILPRNSLMASKSMPGGGRCGRLLLR